jgi:hypothetical protein
MAELEEVDDADLRSLAPDLYRLSHLPQNEP